MMINKVILIDHENYTVRREELFYIRELISFGYEVEVWDISQLLYPGIVIIGSIDAPFVKKISDKKTLAEYFSQVDNGNTAFIVEVPDSYQNRFIYLLLAKTGCKTIKINCYGNSELEKTKLDRLRKLFQGGFARVLKDNLLYRMNLLYKRVYGIHFPDYYLTSNYEACTHHINHPDFEKIRDYKDSPIVLGGYIVFVDIYFPYHPDFKTFYHYNKVPDASTYHITMNRFFDDLESRYKMPVVIAAHPKADYKGDEFGGRKIIRMHTDNLLHYCKMAVLHISCSLSYVMYDNKPTVFVVTDELNEMTHFRYRIKKLVNYCHKDLYNLSDVKFNQIEVSPFSLDVRNDYIYTYLTSKETENINNRDILRRLLEML